MKLTCERLRHIASLADTPVNGHNPVVMREELQRRNAAIGTLVDLCTELLREDMRHLHLLEFKKSREGRNGDARAFDAWETAQNTLRDREEMLAALIGGRGRG